MTLFLILQKFGPGGERDKDKNENDSNSQVVCALVRCSVLFIA